MITKMKDESNGYGPHRLYTVRSHENGQLVNFEASKDDGLITATVREAEFIAAVETELNGIFISRDELPTEFSTEGLGPYADVVTDGRTVFQFNRENDTYEGLRQSALNVLAAAEYLKKNPPVLIDQKQVDALAQILADNENWSVCGRHKATARKILASGKVTVND